MKLKYCVLVILWPVLNSCAQNASTSKPLNVGDTIPYIILTDVVNFPVSKIHLSNLKGKVIVLDFWATWCGSCIKKLPMVDSAQRKFKEHIQIILVNSITGTGDTKEQVSNFFNRKIAPKGKSFTVPIVREDTLLRQLFPHTYLPHYVWIDANGKVIGITSSAGFTNENILAALKGCVLKKGSIEEQTPAQE